MAQIHIFAKRDGFERLVGAALVRCVAIAVSAALMSSAHAAAAPAAAVAEIDSEAIARGLAAQFQASLIRERRLADDREQRLIAAAELRLTRARQAVEAAQGDARIVQRELDAARQDYASLVEGIAQRDAQARAQIESYRREAAEMIARANPEKRAALQRFADGDRVGAWPVLEEITQLGVQARLAAADAAAAADLQELERLRREKDEVEASP